MATTVVAIRLSMVNCYLLKSSESFVLIDTGFPWQRSKLRNALQQAGCTKANLRLVLVTHSDFDHTGNCAWLRKKYGVPVAMHRAEAAAVEAGRMLQSREHQPGPLARTLIYLVGLLAFRRFKPEVLLSEGDDLSSYGIDARVFHIPGHSTGSIGVLTGDGSFFCGDLLTTKQGKPVKGALVDEANEMDASIERLKSLDIKTVYPGHGRPFTMAEYLQNNA